MKNRPFAAGMLGASLLASSALAEDAFDREAWMSAAGLPPKSDAREAMAPALEARLPGLSREDVRALLGAPEEIHGQSFVYALASRFFGAEYRVLLVEFDESDLVTTARNVSTETWK